MTPKQEKFIIEYIKNQNATQAAIKAGYNKNTAYSMGQRLLKHVEIKKAINETLQAMKTDDMIEAKEIQELLTKIARGQEKDIVVTQKGQILETKAKLSDRINALDKLAKIHGLYDKKIEIQGQVPIVIVDGDKLE